jgi:hypothetical protein
MFKASLKEITNVESIKPIAYLDDLSGVKLIVEIPELQRNERFAFLLPPDYKISQLVSAPMAASAIIKHSYIPLPQETLLKDPEELKNFVKKLHP